MIGEPFRHRPPIRPLILGDEPFLAQRAYNNVEFEEVGE